MPTLREIHRLVGGDLRGPPDLAIEGVGSLEQAGPCDLAPIDSATRLRAAHASKAGALLAARDLGEALERPHILLDHPLFAMNAVIGMLGLVSPPPEPGIHPTALVDATAQVGEGCHIAAYVVVGPEVRLGKGGVVHPHVTIERGVTLGEGCTLEPGCVLHEGAVLGCRVRIGAHAVISRQGFGYAPGPQGPVLLHHVGRVVIEDDVHVGAGTMIDRARFDETRIGRHTALDNLIHIGHNCAVGARSFLAAQTGLAGNARIGSDCQIGGQVGIANHCGVGDRSRVAAKSGLIRMHGDEAELMWYPARERREVLRYLATLERLSRARQARKGDSGTDR